MIPIKSHLEIEPLAELKAKFQTYSLHGGNWNYLISQLNLHSVPECLSNLAISEIKKGPLGKEKVKYSLEIFETIRSCIVNGSFNSYYASKALNAGNIDKWLEFHKGQ